MSAETGKKLSGEMILEAMEYIDDALIEEADAFRRGERRAASDSVSNTAAGRRRSALRWVTLLAACFCVVAILGRSGILQRPLGMGSAAPSSAPAADSAAVASAEESAAAVAPAEKPAAPAPAEAAPAAVDEGGAPAAGGAADSHTYITAEEKAETQGSMRESNSEQFNSEAKTEAAAPSEAAPEAEEAVAEAEEAVPEAEQAALTGAQESAQYDADAAEETMETVVFDDGTRGIYAQVFLSTEETERLPQSIGEPLALADGTVWYGMEGINSAAFLIREEKTMDGVIYTLWERRE